MSLSVFVMRARRALRKPPSHLTRRLLAEVQHELDRFTQPRLGRLFDERELLRRTGAHSLDALWERLLTSSFWAFDPSLMRSDQYERACPGDRSRIIEAAERAARHEIDLMGSGPVQLGERIDWHRDYKTGDRWPLGYFRRIDYINRGRPSDIKTAWELSRLQWALPCAQAYVLTSDERYATVLRDILEQWIDANPYAGSVNWGVTMEPAMRIFTWTWMFRACGRSQAWAAPAFRAKFLAGVYLHGLFTEHFLERSDINGNHFTADAAALVIVGSFFRDGQDAPRWLQSGLQDLEREIPLQVHPDGVDFEASTAYHRLVAELFLAASMAATASGRPLSSAYRDRLAGMARFTAAYMRPDNSAPLWGDHDDAMTLPLGPQSIRDHRYLIGLIALHLGDVELLKLAGGPRAEAAWWFGTDAAARLGQVGVEPGSQAFHEGGVYVMRGGGDHVFIDCGPVGLAGRGGHGHNDLLSFEAVLDGVPLVTEGGCYVYTADFASRNRDRATLSHNSPIVDGEEINRFLGPELLWFLLPDARHEIVEFTTTASGARFSGRHDGFQRLPSPVTVERVIELAHDEHCLRVADRFLGTGTHHIEVPLHLHPEVHATTDSPDRVWLASGGRQFELVWSGPGWSLEIGKGREASSYGYSRAVTRLTWRRSGELAGLEVSIRARAARS